MKNKKQVGWLLRLIVIPVLLAITLAGCGGGGGGDDIADSDDSNDGGVVTSLMVTATNPEHGETGIPLDRMIAVSFSESLDPESIEEDSIVMQSNGVSVKGQITVNKQTILFMVAAMEKNSVYTLTIKPSIRGLDGLSLDSEQSFTFTTGQTYTDGSLPLNENFKPFGSGEFVTLIGKKEYLLLGLDNFYNVQLIDPLKFNSEEDSSASSGNVLYTDSNPALVTANKKRTATGSFDHDFYEEVAVISWSATGTGTLTIYDHGKDSQSRISVDVALEIDSRPEGAYQYDIASGDIDNDGLDEVLVVGVIDGALASERKGKIWIFDDLANSSTLLYSADLEGEFDPDIGNVGLDRVAIASGNVDNDNAIETVVAYYLHGRPNASVLVLDDAEHQYDILRHDLIGDSQLIPTASISPDVQRYLRVDTGDTDADGRDEILVAWMKLDDVADQGGIVYQSKFWLLDDRSSSFSLISERSGFSGSYLDTDTLIPEAKLVDLNGDRTAELFVMGTVWHYYEEMDDYIDISDGLNSCGNFSMIYASDNTLFGRSVAVADINGDMREDIVVYRTDSSIDVIACIEHPHYNPDTGELESVSNAFEIVDSLGPYPYAAYSESAVVAAVNVDQDSLVVQYGGNVPDTASSNTPNESTPTVRMEHSVYFADNRLIAVVAAPPCADGIGQNVDGCSAGFGTMIGAGLTSGFTVAVRGGVLVGVEEEIQGGFVFASITLQKFEAEVSAELELSAYIDSSIETSKTITNSTVYGEDIVVFSTTPYDRYIYQVVSHSDEVADGKLMTIDIPQRPRILTVTREYYNAFNGEQMDIGSSILKHVPGQLDTYPRSTDVNGYFSFPNLVLGSSGAQTVNQGSGSREVQLEIATELGIGVDLTLNVDSTVKVCGATVCGGVTRGWSIGTSFGATLSSATTFISEVGAIDAANYPIYNYTYGMFAYTQLVYDPAGKRMQNFIVVNHWVDD